MKTIEQLEGEIKALEDKREELVKELEAKKNPIAHIESEPIPPTPERPPKS